MSPVMKCLTISVLFLMLCFSVNANAMKNSARLWGAVQFSSPVFNSKSWEYRLELHARSQLNDSEKDRDSSILRLGVGHILNNRQTIWLGYDAVPSLEDDGGVNVEQRLWQQLSWSVFENRKNQWQSRTRLEERKDEGSDDIAYRLRQRFTVSLNERLFWHAIPVIYDELFINLNRPSWVTTEVVDQNRFFLGIKIPIGKKSSLQIGYINQVQFKDSENQMNHILSISLGIGIDPILGRVFGFGRRQPSTSEQS